LESECLAWLCGFAHAISAKAVAKLGFAAAISSFADEKMAFFEEKGLPVPD
jgi:hypothetical protein